MREGPLEGLPYWMQFIALIGVPSFLLVFLLGAIPGLPSPYTRMSELVIKQQSTIQLRDRALRQLNYEILKAVQQACRGTWRGNPAEQAVCTKEWTVPELQPRPWAPPSPPEDPPS